MLEKLMAATGSVVLILFVVCVVKNVGTEGQYHIPTEVTSVMAAMVTFLFSVPAISYLMRRK